MSIKYEREREGDSECQPIQQNQRPVYCCILQSLSHSSSWSKWALHNRFYDTRDCGIIVKASRHTCIGYTKSTQQVFNKSGDHCLQQVFRTRSCSCGLSNDGTISQLAYVPSTSRYLHMTQQNMQQKSSRICLNYAIEEDKPQQTGIVCRIEFLDCGGNSVSFPTTHLTHLVSASCIVW